MAVAPDSVDAGVTVGMLDGDRAPDALFRALCESLGLGVDDDDARGVFVGACDGLVDRDTAVERLADADRVRAGVAVSDSVTRGELDVDRETVTLRLVEMERVAVAVPDGERDSAGERVEEAECDGVFDVATVVECDGVTDALGVLETLTALDFVALRRDGGTEGGGDGSGSRVPAARRQCTRGAALKTREHARG